MLFRECDTLNKMALQRKLVLGVIYLLHLRHTLKMMYLMLLWNIIGLTLVALMRFVQLYEVVKIPINTIMRLAR
ncbi:hypothetical protein D3C87_1736640 [compost metagenome]